MKKILGSLLAVVVLLAVMVTPVMADTDGTVITGTVEKAIAVSAPAAFGMTLNPASTQPIESSAQTATVDANHTGWTLTVVEEGTSPDGKMEKTGPVTLTNPLQAKGGDETTYTSLASVINLETGGDSIAGEAQTIDVYFAQTVDWGDEAGAYTITVTFTATPGS